MESDERILYIRPAATISAEPIIDEYTRKMTAAYRKSTLGKVWRGSHGNRRGRHTCSCGVLSDNAEHKLPNGAQTNSLCIHYLAFHRDDVPADELEKVAALDYGQEEPTAEELHVPGHKPWPRRPIMR